MYPASGVGVEAQSCLVDDPSACSTLSWGLEPPNDRMTPRQIVTAHDIGRDETYIGVLGGYRSTEEYWEYCHRGFHGHSC